MSDARPDEATTPLIPVRPGRRRRVAVILGVLAVLAFILRAPLFQGNFATVEPGRVYRSAQPGANFENAIRQHGLRSVLNLRGGSRRDAFYRDEVAVAERLGVEFYDIPISATKRPTRRDLMLAIAVLERCEYPLLIHCKWGSDRTGMVSALYRMIVRGESPDTAIDAFSIAHGHVPLFGPQKLHEPLNEYATWLKAHARTHDRQTFLDWVVHHYEAPDRFAGWPDVKSGPRSFGPPAGQITRE